ncbi:MAG: TetR family transcriptional regulator, partial [Clostridia bacterium]|nr:TetR family transcriptional regulator [Clostridia bacterium]
MDRRVKKTQTAIRKAFTELIKEKGNVDEITIKEIVDRADISRSTFYTHYSDILELTDDISNMFAEEIAELVIDTHKRIDGNESYDHIYLEVLNYMLDRKELTRVMLTDMRNTALSNRIADLIMERMEDY